MKNFLILVVACVISFAIVAWLTWSPSTEPALPADIGTYQKQEFTCDKHAGKTLVQQSYVLESEDSLKAFLLLFMNGKKIYQLEYTETEAGVTEILYVRNSPGNGDWLTYQKAQAEEADEDQAS